jgi:alanine racemase
VNAPERALATIELGAIERNCARLPKPLCAVVKSDAYGHGPVAAAALAGGATWLAVAAARRRPSCAARGSRRRFS